MTVAIIKLDDVAKQEFPNGATYQTIVGDADGSAPVRIGVQVSPPGYSTGTHAHPYMEIVSVLEGTGVAWMEGVEGMMIVDIDSFRPQWARGWRAVALCLLTETRGKINE